MLQRTSHRLSFLIESFRFLLLGLLILTDLICQGQAVAQEIQVPIPLGYTDSGTENLAFSNDGHLLREIEGIVAPGNPEGRYLRAITYDASTGIIRHDLNLHSMRFLSASSDGRSVIIATWEQQDRGILVNTETGKMEVIPPPWGAFPSLSGDGRLVGTFKTDGSSADDFREIVSLYNWRTKQLVAQQSSGWQGAGGIDYGGVTEDGKIEFGNNRTGMGVIDPKTGKDIVSIGTASVRSPDGKWVIDVPYYAYADPPEEGPVNIDIKNGTGGQVGTLLQVMDVNAWQWHYAFCGTSGRFVVEDGHTLSVYEIPSGKFVASFAVENGSKFVCNSAGKRIAVRAADRLTFHDLN